MSRDGHRVMSCVTEPGGAFELGPLEDGEYDVFVSALQSEGVAGLRRFWFRERAGPNPVEFFLPIGLRVLLRDAEGEPVTSTDTEIEIALPGLDEPRRERFNCSGSYSELRMDAMPETKYTVTVRAAGYLPATATVTTDTDAHADVTMRLKPSAK